MVLSLSASINTVSILSFRSVTSFHLYHDIHQIADARVKDTAKLV